MDSFVISWRELLVVLVIVLAVYIAEMLLLIRASRRPGMKLWQRGALVSSQQAELNALQAEISALRNDLESVRASVAQLRQPPPAPMGGMAAASGGGLTPYAQAIQLARQGCDVGEVAMRCGISRGEAELIVAMHRGSEP